jgi:CDP-diacylglycerol--serine O-phosphatidyltransferase
MTGFGTHLIIVLVPLILTGILHMVAVRLGWLGVLQIPIWRGGFGANKTWRGIVFVPAANAAFVVLISNACRLEPGHPILLGFALGLSYVLFELPNSYIKRKAGIEAGGHHRRYKYLFYLLDKTDSSLGVTLTYAFISGISLSTAVALFLVNSMTHAAVAFTLVKLKIKSSF